MREYNAAKSCSPCLKYSHRHRPSIVLKTSGTVFSNQFLPPERRMTYLNILFVTYSETASAFAKDLFPQGTEDCIKVLGYVQQKVVANTVFL